MNELDIHREFEERGYSKKDMDKWLECDHQFDLKAYVLNVDNTIHPMTLENTTPKPQKPITSFETVCRFCHIRESLWKEVFV